MTRWFGALSLPVAGDRWLSRLIRACLVHGHTLPSESVTSHKSVAAIKSVAMKYEAKLWQKLATTITL
jgi:hypothetical protein